MSLFLHEWSSGGLDAMKEDFRITDADLVDVEVLLAAYEYEAYEGSAYVLFRKGADLFEVVGGHCSCYGLNEFDYSGNPTTQWQPEATTVDAIRRRIDTAYEFSMCREQLRAVLDTLEAAQ